MFDRNPEMRPFMEAVIAEANARGVPEHENIPDDVVDTVVERLYGGWTDEARGYVRMLEFGKPEDEKRFPKEV